MGKRGPKPKGKVKIKWSANFAYAIGLIATDGCLSDGRHIIMTSKDIEQLNNFLECLSITNKIGIKSNGHGQTAFLVQFSDVLFYRFLESIGMTQAKSLTMGELDIPNDYFIDFLRGCFDGDGCSYSYWDPRWKSSFMFYVSFASGSKDFINWIRKEIQQRIGITGHLSVSKKDHPYYQIKYAKYEGIKLVKEMYKNKKNLCLSRKKLKINKALSTIGVPQIKWKW